MVTRLDARAQLTGQHGYGILLALIVASAIYTVAAPDTQWWRLGTVVLQAAIVLAAVLSADARGGVRLVIGVAVVAALIAAVVSALSAGDSQTEFSLLAALLAAMVPVIVGRGLLRTLRAEGASERVIAGALSVYLLIGMFCAYAYGAIGAVGDGPLFAAGEGDGSLADHVYFSFTTQTTVGFGDLAVVEPVGRSLVIAQALTGQLYLVTVVSLLVGGFLGRVRAAPAPDERD